MLTDILGAMATVAPTANISSAPSPYHPVSAGSLPHPILSALCRASPLQSSGSVGGASTRASSPCEDGASSVSSEGNAQHQFGHSKCYFEPHLQERHDIRDAILSDLGEPHLQQRQGIRNAILNDLGVSIKTNAQERAAEEAGRARAAILSGLGIAIGKGSAGTASAFKVEVREDSFGAESKEAPVNMSSPSGCMSTCPFQGPKTPIGDASQRGAMPMPMLPTGAAPRAGAVGDASQRSPMGSTNQGSRPCFAFTPVPTRADASQKSFVSRVAVSSACAPGPFPSTPPGAWVGASASQEATRTGEAFSRNASAQRPTSGSPLSFTSPADLKCWLSNMGSSETLAERLRAAAHETYED